MVRRVPDAKVIVNQATTLLLAAIVLLSMPSGSQAATHYVVANANGASDDNDGSRAVFHSGRVGPWQTIRKAMQMARTGDTVFVGSGRYCEEVSITASGIQLRALGRAKPLVDGENVRLYGITNPGGVRLQDVLIESLEIANCTVAGVMISGRDSRGVVNEAWSGSSANGHRPAPVELLIRTKETNSV